MERPLEVVRGTELQECLSSPSGVWLPPTGPLFWGITLGRRDTPQPAAAQGSQRDLRQTVTFAETLGGDREGYVADRILRYAGVLLVTGIPGVPGDSEVCFLYGCVSYHVPP